MTCSGNDLEPWYREPTQTWKQEMTNFRSGAGNYLTWYEDESKVMVSLSKIILMVFELT